MITESTRLSSGDMSSNFHFGADGLMERNVAAGEIAAGGVTVAELD